MADLEVFSHHQGAAHRVLAGGMGDLQPDLVNLRPLIRTGRRLPGPRGLLPRYRLRYGEVGGADLADLWIRWQETGTGDELIDGEGASPLFVVFFTVGHFRGVENRSRIVEITSRTLHGRFLMRPSNKVNDLILGVLGRAQAKYDVTLYAFVFLSNHFHLLMLAESVKQMAYFNGFLKANIAKELGRLHHWKEKFWGRRYHHGVIADREHDLTKRLRYILANGTKEGLVASPVDWPGVSSAWAQMKGIRTLQGTWYNRTAQYRAFLKGERKQFPSTEAVRLSPLPFLAGESRKQQRAFYTNLIESVEGDARESRHESESPAMGREAILREDPHAMPENFKRSPAPAFYASNREDYWKLRNRRSERLAEYRAAAEKLRSGELDVEFPEDCFPPRLPFVKRRAPT